MMLSFNDVAIVLLVVLALGIFALTVASIAAVHRGEAVTRQRGRRGLASSHSTPDRAAGDDRFPGGAADVR
ncbi:MAG: hypothetical protein NVS2B9_17690 [Myxococcales bacterium]